MVLAPTSTLVPLVEELQRANRQVGVQLAWTIRPPALVTVVCVEVATTTMLVYALFVRAQPMPSVLPRVRVMRATLERSHSTPPQRIGTERVSTTTTVLLAVELESARRTMLARRA